jgi:hypothetical protein
METRAAPASTDRLPHQAPPSALTQLMWLFVLAMPVACISWTLTREEITREVREYLVMERSNPENGILTRKVCYLLTCHYCFSHYVTLFFLIVTRFKLLRDGWRGYLIAFFSVVWVANFYMVIFRNLVG